MATRPRSLFGPLRMARRLVLVPVGAPTSTFQIAQLNPDRVMLSLLPIDATGTFLVPPSLDPVDGVAVATGSEYLLEIAHHPIYVQSEWHARQSAAALTVIVTEVMWDQ